MRLNKTLAKLTNGPEFLGEWFYFITALDKPIQATAILNPEKKNGYNLTAAFKDNVGPDYVGARRRHAGGAAQATDGPHVGNMAEGHARVKMDEVRRHIERTGFAWIGGCDSNSAPYHRMHSPVIEFDHQRPANLRKPSENPALPARQHIHTAVRTPNGNEYGNDLPRQHSLAHPHA